ncbi:hypothetical protein NSQ90_24205 [Paenibacillus sp. FSL H7-0737]|nr:hypothetical protein [Paenibacillus sp. FSL H7-0737]
MEYGKEVGMLYVVSMECDKECDKECGEECRKMCTMERNLEH